MAKFLFKKHAVEQNIKKLNEAFVSQEINFRIFYSVKTNFSEPVLETINQHCSFEIVSDYEWELVKKYHIKHLVLNGPSKSVALVKDIINSGVERLFLNIDNDTDIELIANLDKKYTDKITIGLRLFINKPGIWNRFGYDVESKGVKKVIKQLGNKLKGFHFHFSTNNFSVVNYSLILEKFNELIKEHNLELEYLDIGGGLPGADEIIYQKAMYQELPKIVNSLVPKNILIISEVGRNLVENAFDLETTIVSKKELDGGNIDVVIDANIMHFPCYWEKKYSIEYKAEKQKGQPVFINIFGNSCMQVDKIAENYLVTGTPEVGDKMLLSRVGAYSLSQASNFITKIPEILIN